jgi:hypothetical protein
MKNKTRNRQWVLWVVSLAVVFITVLDIHTAYTQHSSHLDEDRRSDIRILAQAVRSLLRDNAAAFDQWPTVFVTGDGTEPFYCRSLNQTIPTKDVKSLLQRYIRLLPRDQGINIPHVSLYYLRQQDGHWLVGNCALSKQDEVTT